MKVSILKNYRKYRKGQLLDLDSKTAYALMQRGIAEKHKMISDQDYIVKDANPEAWPTEIPD